MKIALASQNRRSLTAHAGKCGHFFVFDTETGGAPLSVNLSPAQVLRNWTGEGEHPLDGVNTLIAASVGTGVAVKLTRRGLRVLASSERDLLRVLERLADDSLPLEPLRSEADARSRPGGCLPQAKPASSPAMQAILGGNRWPVGS